MCLEDIAIGRSSVAYPRTFGVTAAVQQCLLANPRRIAVIIPATPEDVIRWNHTGAMSGLFLSPTYMTGFNSGFGQFSGSSVQLGLTAFGAVAQLPLFCQGTGPFNVDIVEILLNVETKEIA